MTGSRDVRVTSARAAELRAELAATRGELLARIEQLEHALARRDDAGERLAHELGTAALRVLRKPTP